MRIRVVFIAWLFGIAVGPATAHAQAIDLDWDDAPLAEALAHFIAQESIDLVYAERLVAGKTTTCRYAGDDVEAALACLLAATGLHAERVRRRQYVLAAVPRAAGTAPPRLPRGALRGFVAEAETGEVLPAAHVFLPDLRLGTITNEAGYFALAALPVQAYRVRVSFLGYHPLDTLLVPGAATTDLRLHAVALETGEVVVERRREVPPVEPGVVNMPVQELEALPSFPGEPDLFQALQWLPGVRKAGEVNGGLVVRGGDPDQNLYLIDGAPVYHPWHAFSLISTFQTETFKDIKLYQGSFPAEHGGRLTAVLDAEMKDGRRNTPRTVAAVGVLSGRFLVEAPVTEAVSFMISGRRSYLDKLIGTKHPVAEDGVRDTLRTGYFFYDLSGKLTLRSGFRHRFSVSYYEGRDELDVRLPFDLSFDFSEWLKPADLFFEVDQFWGNRLVSARYQHLFSRRFFVTATAYRSSYAAREGTIIRPTAASLVTSAYQVRLRDLGLKIDLDYYPSLAHQLRAGVQLVQRGFRSQIDARIQRSPGAVDGLDQLSRLEAFEAVAYIQDTWQPTARWQIQPGLRASFFGGGDYARLSPRLGLRYALRPEFLVLRGSAGVQVQYLQRLRDRVSLLYDLVSSRWVPASEAVRPSRSVQVAVGAEAYPRPGLTLAADAYWRESDGVLLPRDVFQDKDGLDGPGIDVGTLLGQYTRGEARAYGLEVSARLERGPWQSWLSFAGGRSLRRAPEQGQQRFRAARFDVPRTLQGALRRQGRRWAFGVSVLLRSGLPYTVPLARYAVQDPLDDAPTRYLYRPELYNGRLPTYLRFDAVVGRRFRLLGARFDATLHLYNVTNRRNVTDRIFDPQQEGRVAERSRRSLPLLPLLEIQMIL